MAVSGLESKERVQMISDVKLIDLKNELESKASEKVM